MAGDEHTASRNFKWQITANYKLQISNISDAKKNSQLRATVTQGKRHTGEKTTNHPIWSQGQRTKDHGQRTGRQEQIKKQKAKLKNQNCPGQAPLADENATHYDLRTVNSNLGSTPRTTKQGRRTMNFELRTGATDNGPLTTDKGPRTKDHELRTPNCGTSNCGTSTRKTPNRTWFLDKARGILNNGNSPTGGLSARPSPV